MDFVQRSYHQIEERLNITAYQAKEALRRLESRGIVKRHFRTEYFGGMKTANVMYLELIPEKLQEITYYSEHQSKEVCRYNHIPVEINQDTYVNSTKELSGCKHVRKWENSQTNTKSTTDIKTKDSSSITKAKQAFMEKIDYESLFRITL